MIEIKRLFALAVFAMALSACGGGGSGIPTVPTRATTPMPKPTPLTTPTRTPTPLPTPTPTPVPTPTPTPMPTPIQAGAQYVALGDSITYGLYAANYATEGYASVFSADIKANLTNLGIPGETSTNIIADEVAKIPSNAQVITLFVGTNDELEFIDINQSAASVESTFSANMARITSMLRTGFPSSRIYVANLPNLANFPEWATGTASTRTAISLMNQAMNAAIDGMGFPVVDLRCDPQTYNAANLYQGGLAFGYVHPNTQGHAYYAADFYATTQGTLRESQSCQYINPI